MLISISGIDGCGKSLQVQLLHRKLEERGLRPVVIKAYDDTAKMACRPFMESWTDDLAIMFLFQALHAQQCSLTKKALREGKVVIADRWDESYLGYHQNFGPLSTDDELRNRLNTLAFGGLLPDFGFVIRVPADVARRRRGTRGKQERFEDRPDSYHEQMQEAYCTIARLRGWTILDGMMTPNGVHDAIMRELFKG